MPTLSRAMCETEIQNASMVWPESVRPLRSTMVTETISGRRFPVVFKILFGGKQRCFAIQRVENRLDEQNIDAALDEAANLFVVISRN